MNTNRQRHAVGQALHPQTHPVVSFQSPAFAREGILDGEVFLARAKDGEAGIGHQRDHAGEVGDGAEGSLVEDPGRSGRTVM